MELLLGSITAAASVGLGCGACCGTAVHAALYSYLMAHVRDMKETMRAYARFLLGKILAVVSLTVLASLLGRSLLDEEGRILGVPMVLLTDAFLALLGITLLLGWVREKRRGSKGCQGCRGCHTAKNETLRPDTGALFGMGFSYGLSPCAPLLLVCGYAAALPAGHAALLGAVFALISTLSPGLLFLLLSGTLARKMREEVGEHLSWLRPGSYVLITALALFHLGREVLL